MAARVSPRVLVLSSEFPPGPGGIGTHAFELTRHLQVFGWEVQVVTSQDYASEAEIAGFNRSQPFDIIRFDSASMSPFKWITRWREASRALTAFRPDIVLASGMRPIWLAALLARRYGLPFVAVGHGTEFGVRSLRCRSLNRWSFGQASEVVCVSEYTWRQMSEVGIRPRGGRIIHNGADPEGFRVLPSSEVAKIRRSLGVDGARLLITVGQVSERKGQSVVIRALARVMRRGGDTHYLIAGLPTEQDRYAQLAFDLGVQDHVHFLGRLSADDLVGAINASDLFVMTSRYTPGGDFEGYGIAVIEAALCGKPAVVSQDSGLVEAIDEGKTGLAVPQDDPEATAEAILELLDDHSRRETMGARARDRALREQTWRARVEEYDGLLQNLVRRVRPLRRRFGPTPKPLHVLHVIDSLALEGAERMLVELATRNRREGLEVTVCVTREGGPLTELLSDDVPVHCLNRRQRFNWKDLQRFGVLVEGQRADVIHAHGRSTCSFVAAAKRAGFTQAPLLLHDHYGRIAIDPAVPLWFRLMVAPQVDKYIGVCEEMADWAVRAGVLSSRVEIIENGINVRRICDALPLDLRAEFGIEADAPVGVVVCNIRPEKGILELIQALSQSQLASPIQLLVVGRTIHRSYGSRCEEEIARRGLAARIRLVGERMDVPQILRGADFAVVPSLSEAGQLVLLESVAAGLPVVATRVGEVSRRLERLGVPGFVPAGDPPALATALECLLQLRPEAMSERGAEGRRAALGHLDVERAVPRWLDIYRELAVAPR